MINSITLKNFQSHKDTHIEFHSGVNAIVGLSDSGKTAILRALNWVVNNKPSGDAFTSHWGGDCVVTIELWDGTTVSRGRTKTDNYYSLNGEMYRAFGQDVPEPVRKAFNMNEINIQAQMDAPFLLSSGPGGVAQILNRVANLDVIDKAISSIRKQKLRADGDLKAEEARVEQLHADFEKFGYLAELEEAISALESLDRQAGGVRIRTAGLQAIVGQVSQAEQRVRGAEYILRAEPLLADVLTLVESRKAVVAEHVRIDEILEQIDQQSKRARVVEKVLGAEHLVEEVLKLNTEYQAKRKDVSQLADLVGSVGGKERIIAMLGDELEKVEQEFHELMPEQCPLCGQEVVE